MVTWTEPYTHHGEGYRKVSRGCVGEGYMCLKMFLPPSGCLAQGRSLQLWPASGTSLCTDWLTLGPQLAPSAQGEASAGPSRPSNPAVASSQHYSQESCCVWSSVECVAGWYTLSLERFTVLVFSTEESNR